MTLLIKTCYKEWDLTKVYKFFWNFITSFCDNGFHSWKKVVFARFHFLQVVCLGFCCQICVGWSRPLPNVYLWYIHWIHVKSACIVGVCDQVSHPQFSHGAPWFSVYVGNLQTVHIIRAFTLVLGTVPAGTCSRYTPFLVVWMGSKESCSR